MVVCKYFLEGNCKFGQNCRFEHTYGGDRGQQQATYYGSYNLKQIWKVLEQEVIAIEKGGQWPLTCYSPLKESICFPGWEDISPEEVRWLMYQARSNGTLEQCMAQINQLYKNAELKRNEIKQPTQETFSIIENLSKGKSVQPSTTTYGSPNQSSVFGITQPTMSAFKFEVPNAPPSYPVFNVFPSSSLPSNTVFSGSGSTQNIFQRPQSDSTNVFGGNRNTPQNVFEEGFGVPASSIFSVNQNSSNIFQSSNQTQQLGSNVNPFQRQNQSQQYTAKKQPDLSVYSKLEELSEDERKMFMAPTFSFGKIPLNPPPLEFCYK